MKLGDFLSSVPRSSAPPERVEFTVIHRAQNGAKTPVRAYAIFDLVTEREQQQAEAEALKALQGQQTDKGVVPAGLPDALERAYFLEAALRDHDSPLERFATAAELQAAVPRRELERLHSAYAVWSENHYPKQISKAARDELKQEARGK